MVAGARRSLPRPLQVQGVPARTHEAPAAPQLPEAVLAFQPVLEGLGGQDRFLGCERGTQCEQPPLHEEEVLLLQQVGQCGGGLAAQGAVQQVVLEEDQVAPAAAEPPQQALHRRQLGHRGGQRAREALQPLQHRRTLQLPRLQGEPREPGQKTPGQAGLVEVPLLHDTQGLTVPRNGCLDARDLLLQVLDALVAHLLFLEVVFLINPAQVLLLLRQFSP
mmetsp:Transcript_2627/g.3584  ORF Transcript_2627/g.3584 Transcript_2627/m.3584 type:complete len:220 (-) Transcript_2627:529-1188(-)